MKTMINKFGILLLFNLFIIISCSENDEPFVANASDVITTIDEHSSNGTSLGTVSTNLTGNLVYSFTSQSIPNALSIDSTTGEVSIADTTKFDFETNPTIEALVSVTNSSDTATANVSISLNNIDDILHFLSDSKQAYIDASAGDWILVTEEEYNTLANNLNEVSKSGTTDVEYNTTPSSVIGSEGYTRANITTTATIPNGGYIFAFKYKTSYAQNDTNSRVKQSSTSNNDGFSNLGETLPSHSGNGEDVYFVLKGSNNPVSATGYLSIYNNSSMKIIEDTNSIGYYYASGDSSSILSGNDTYFINLYQGLSTNQKQWD